MATSVPQSATLSQSVTVTWSDGTPFNGFLLIGLVYPTSGSEWAEVDLGGQSPGERLPQFQRVPIVNGQYDNSVGVLYNSSISPPNTKYVAWFYDQSTFPPRQICGPTSFFTVTSSPLTPPTCSLTIPTAGTEAPVPDGDSEGRPVTMICTGGYYTLTYASTIIPDLANGINQALTATGNVSLEAPIYTNGTLVPGILFSYKHIQDSTGGRTLTFDALDFVGVADQDPSLDPDTYTNYTFRYNPLGKWELVGVLKGLS